MEFRNKNLQVFPYMKYEPNISEPREGKILTSSFASELSEEGFKVVKGAVDLIASQNPSSIFHKGETA